MSLIGGGGGGGGAEEGGSMFSETNFDNDIS